MIIKINVNTSYQNLLLFFISNKIFSRHNISVKHNSNHYPLIPLDYIINQPIQNAWHANKLMQFVTFIIEAYNEFQQTI